MIPKDATEAFEKGVDLRAMEEICSVPIDIGAYKKNADKDPRPPEPSTNGKEPPFSKQLREEVDSQSSKSPEAIPASSEETEAWLKQYAEDPEPFPMQMRSEAFHGVLGDIVRLMAQHCEASPEALLIHGIVIIGNMLGRCAYVDGGGPKLYPNEFAVIVGETARGRKGTAYSMWEQLGEHVNPDWCRGCFASSTQTGEGIVHRVRDERYGVPPGKKKKHEPSEEVLLDQGVSDKRLLILEEEFSHALKMAQRSGNTLSETLRRAWDSPHFLRNDNKNSPLTASDPHVSMIGHTTRAELLKTLNRVDLNNGMANRVLWCASRKTGDMPNVERLDWEQHPDLIGQLKQVLKQRLANTDDPAFFSRTPDAKKFWDTLYRKLNAEKQNGTIDNVLARDTSHILKVALTFAVCDEADQIDVCHLKAALAVVDYCRDGARWIFGKATGNKLANNILAALRRERRGMTRTQIIKDVCYGNTPKSQLDTALTELVQNKLAHLNLKKNEKGQPIERWFSTT
jgi:hypothetical protein